MSLPEGGDHTVLGRTVTVTIDRPLGSAHPRRPDLLYTVNYGYVAGVMGGDGQPQDAYILGVDTPLAECSGRIIAVAVRKDDDEDKWVVAPEGTVLYEPDIARALRFVEQYFDTHYACLYEKSCGAVLYTYAEGEARFLLIRNESGHIGFPKGHVEYGETEEETALREIYEETGIKTALRPGFREYYDYIVDEYVHKRAVYFLAEYGDTRIRIRKGEIFDYWLVPYDKATELLNFEQDRVVIEKAMRHILKGESIWTV